MHRFEGAKLREIAAHLGISVTTAHERIARAMALIRQAVRDDA
jgi:DNA-directed RNA polymerase specialized sigma24 family protein